MQDVVRICADWARHPTEGIVAHLATVPLEPGVPRVSGLSITDECTDKVAALQQIPDAGLPLVQILRGDQLGAQDRPAVRPMPADGTTQIGFRFITKATDPRAALAAADQVDRATRRCLGRLFSAPGNEAARVRNDVQVTDPTSWDNEIGFTNNDTLLTLTLVVTLSARDVYTARP